MDLAHRLCTLPGMALTLMPTWVLWASTRARRSLLPLLGPRKLLRNLVLYFRLSPHTPHCQACLLSRPGESSQVQRSMRPALQARASACVRAAADIAYRKAVSLKPVQEERKLRSRLQPFEGRSGVGWMVGRVREWNLRTQRCEAFLLPAFQTQAKSCPLNSLQTYSEACARLSGQQGRAANLSNLCKR